LKSYPERIRSVILKVIFPWKTWPKKYKGELFYFP